MTINNEPPKNPNMDQNFGQPQQNQNMNPPTYYHTQYHPQMHQPVYPVGYWGWVVVSIVLFPIMLFWQLPAAARVYPEWALGNFGQAEELKHKVKNLGIASLIIGICIIIFAFFSELILVGSAMSSINSTNDLISTFFN